jgi:hypothetical protein
MNRPVPASRPMAAIFGGVPQYKLSGMSHLMVSRASSTKTPARSGSLSAKSSPTMRVTLERRHEPPSLPIATIDLAACATAA